MSDIISVGWSTVECIIDPSKENFENLSADVVGALIPGVPAAGTVKRVGKYAGKLFKGSDNVADAGKFVPNPHGRKGGIPHQKGVDNARLKAESDFKGHDVDIKTEGKIDTPGGHKEIRYGDVVVYDKAGKPKKAYQVGDKTKGGIPISRERRALDDIGGSGVPVEYFPKIEQ